MDSRLRPPEGTKKTSTRPSACAESDASRCPVCAANALRAWRDASPSDPTRSARRRYALDRCDRCRSAALRHDERQLEDVSLYEGGTYADPIGFGAAVALYRALVAADRARLVRALPTGSRLLEIGSGDGRLLELMSARGHKVEGIEQARPSVARARARGLRVHETSVYAFDAAPGSYDAVILWHVLEHLPDPGSVLQRIRQWLVPGGHLVVALPNFDSLQARVGGDNWFHQDIPRHVTQMTMEGLALLLERSGFRVDRTHHLLFEHNPIGMLQTLVNRLTCERDAAFRAVKGMEVRSSAGGRAALALTVVLSPLAVILECAAALSRRGGTVVVHAS